MTTKERIAAELEQLNSDQQLQVLDFIQRLSARPRGTPGTDLLRFAGLIELDDLARMQKAIDEDCETIEPDRW